MSSKTTQAMEICKKILEKNDFLIVGSWLLQLKIYNSIFKIELFAASCLN